MFHFLKNIAFLIPLVLYGVVFYFYQKNIYSYTASLYPKGDFILSYINGILVFFTVIIIFSLLRDILRSILRQIFQYFELPLKKQEAMFTKFVRKFLWIVKITSAISAGLLIIKKDKFISPLITNIEFIFAVLLIVYFVSGIARLLLDKQFQISAKLKSSNASFIKFSTRLVVLFIWIVGIAYTLSQFWYNLTALLAWAGIGWLAVALAAQKSLTNIFGAITIVANKPFNIGDYISINTQEGVVKDIGLSYVTLTDRAWHQVMIPNENIITSSIANFSVRESRRVDFAIGVVYSTSLEKVKEGVLIIENILKNYVTKWEITEDVRVIFDMFNAFSLDIKVTYFSLSWPIQEFNHQKQSINLEIKDEFEKAGIEMAFPTQEMIIKDSSSPIKAQKSSLKKV